MRFESRRGSKRKNKKTTFCKLKSFFFFLLFFITPLPLHFKDDFFQDDSFALEELEVVLP
jgi:hypothetical protein